MAVPYVTIALLERTLWTQTNSKITNVAVAFAKAFVAYKIAGILGSDMELEVLPEMPSMPDVEGMKDSAEYMWENKEEGWEALVQSIKEITLSDVMNAINERGKLRSFFELSGMGNGLAMFLSLEKLLFHRKKDDQETEKQ